MRRRRIIIMQLSTSFLGNQLRATRAASALNASGTMSTATRQVTTMAKKKGVRMIVTLECTEARALGKPPSRYTTEKVSKTHPNHILSTETGLFYCAE